MDKFDVVDVWPVDAIAVFGLDRTPAAILVKFTPVDVVVEE